MEFTPIKDFLNYLKFPTRRAFPNPAPKPLLYVTLLFICAFIINIFAIAFVNAAIVNLENIGNVFEELDYGFAAMFGIAVIAAPIAEEFIFRFPLKFKIPLAILIGLILAGFASLFTIDLGWGPYAYIISGVVFVAIVYLFITNDRVDQDDEALLDRFFPILFYLVAMAFAYIHIYNYDSSQFSVWMTPFIVIPQFILALFLGFVRMRIGLWASIYMHALNNCIPLILFYSLKDVVLPG